MAKVLEQQPGKRTLREYTDVELELMAENTALADTAERLRQHLNRQKQNTQNWKRKYDRLAAVKKLEEIAALAIE